MEKREDMPPAPPERRVRVVEVMGVAWVWVVVVRGAWARRRPNILDVLFGLVIG